MNFFLCSSFAFFLTISQAIAVAAKSSGKKTKPKSKAKHLSTILIALIVVFVVVGACAPRPDALAFSHYFPAPVLVIVGVVIFCVLKRRTKKKVVTESSQDRGEERLLETSRYPPEGTGF